MFFFYVIYFLASGFLSANGKPLYLCNDTHFSDDDYSALDQCYAKPGSRDKNMGVNAFGFGDAEQEPLKSFGFKFQINAKCDKGMLICYPSALDTHAEHLLPGIQFKMAAKNYTSVANECNQKQMEECKGGTEEERNQCLKQIWHGFKVSTKLVEKKYYEVRLEMAISEHKFILRGMPIKASRDQTMFQLWFGTPNNLFTFVTDEWGRQIQMPDDDLIRDTFLSRVGRGAHLSKFGGLWMLGLDLLPFHLKKRVELHMYRECGCEMHAWFVHPGDQPPSNIPGPVPMPLNCTNHTSSAHFVLDREADVDNSVTIRFRLNQEPNKTVEIRFGSVDKDASLKNDSLIMTMKSGQNGTFYSNQSQINDEHPDKGGKPVIGTAKFREIELNKTEDKYMKVVLTIREHFYEVSVNGVPLERPYFPWNLTWWYSEQMNPISHIWISGHMYPESIVQPEVEHMPKKIPRRAQPWDKVMRLKQPLGHNATVIIRGQVAEDAEEIKFLFLQDVPEPNNYIGATVLAIHVKSFSENENGENENLMDMYANLPLKDSVPRVYVRRNFTVCENETCDFLQRKRAFEFRLSMHFQKNGEFDANFSSMIVVHTSREKEKAKGFQLPEPIILNNSAINHIRISGDLMLFEEPIIENEIMMGIVKAIGVWPPLLPGDNITIRGQIREDAKRLFIIFLHRVPDTGMYGGDLPFLIRFNLTHRVTLMNSVTQNTKELAQKEKTPWIKILSESRVSPGETFEIRIEILHSKLRIQLHGALLHEHKHVLPPWSIDFIRMVEDSTSKQFHLQIDRSNRSVGQTLDPPAKQIQLPYVLAVPFEKQIRAGDSIHIVGIVTRHEPKINVSLLSGALETYYTVAKSVKKYHKNLHLPKIGKVVLLASFNRTHLNLSQRFQETDECQRLGTFILTKPLDKEEGQMPKFEYT